MASQLIVVVSMLKVLGEKTVVEVKLKRKLYSQKPKPTRVENRGMNMEHGTTGPGTSSNINDIGFRLILIPCFGITIPLVSGQLQGFSFSLWETKLSFLYTIALALVIWQGNRYLLFTLRSYFNWFNHPVRKIAALILAVTFYTVPLSMLMMIGWYHLFAGGIVNWDITVTTTLIIMICVIFIVHVYETVFLVKDSETEMLRNARLERARAEAELEALKNQIDPHFIFNSLNTLSHLITEHPQKAREFNEHLADVYRYILQNKAGDLVLLREETGFVQQYFSMLKIRFGNALQLEMKVPSEAMEQFLLLPISLQLLLENAVKHNEFSAQEPLALRVLLEGQTLLVTNEIRIKEQFRPPSGTGLRNLSERYRLVTGKDILVSAHNGTFAVELPLLPLA